MSLGTLPKGGYQRDITKGRLQNIVSESKQRLDKAKPRLETGNWKLEHPGGSSQSKFYCLSLLLTVSGNGVLLPSIASI